MKFRKENVPALPEGAISKDVVLDKKDKLTAAGVTGLLGLGVPGIATAIQGERILTALQTNPDFWFTSIGIMVAISTIAGATISKFFLLDTQQREISETINENPNFYHNGKAQLAMSESKKGRVLMNSFSIKDTVDPEANTWKQYPNMAVEETEATHTVKHYLVKANKGFRVEQEVIPNDETIWDISADALVEVYEVQEKTKKHEEVSA